MADNLIFPIGFDLEEAVKKAGQEWNSTYADKLEKLLAKRAITVNLGFSTKNLNNLDDVKRRFAELKIEPLTPENKTAIRDLVRELKELAKAMEKVQKYSNIQTPELQQALANKANAEAAHMAEKYRQANERLEVSKRRVALAEQKHAEAMQRSANKSKELTTELQQQDGYVSRLVKRLAVYASFSAFKTLLTSIREVTAEFELQRVSLGAIIQDQTRANQLFSEIKAFALKSPLKILDLTKYTKQVAAYRIETDKLFDTTKRLADVSVGLGVDMGRLVLAYGQVKAASYLRAAEIRQFTEAGIPMLELLAEKFTKLQGSAVSTEEVMDKVSKRMVSFGMVEEIFKDMTDAGGMFYNMQEKQSQILYGMWAKMGDAAAVMYEQMGNTATANQGMKDAIQLLSDMMLHWTALANVAQTAAVGFLAYKAAMTGLIPFYGLQTKLTVNQIKAEKAKQAQQIKTLAVGRALTREEQLAIMSKNKLVAADYKRLITEGKLSAAQKLSLGRQAASNVQLRRAVLEMNLFTKAQITALGKMSGWQFFWAKFKLQMQGIGQAFLNLGRTMMTFAPLAAITAVIDLFMDWRQAIAAQEEAVKKVEKQYEETKVTLMQIENAYRDIQTAAKDAGENEEEFAKTSYSQKLEQLQKIIKLLGQFGMKNVIDPSVLDYTNIDPVLDKWLAKLNEVNELARGWGREVALVANAYEGNIFGWSVFGENLKEDMKDLERAWTKLTVNPEFNASLEQLRAVVGNLANNNKEVYDDISRAIGADLKLALQQKRKNETELQYQQRIYKNYQDIYSWIKTKMGVSAAKLLPKLEAGDVQSMLNDFQGEVDEVMHEFDKVKEKFRGQDALTVKMAIDTVAAENDWTEWQKELLIQHLNEDPITLNAEIIPVGNEAGVGAIYEGMKAIITSEFPSLFNPEELQSLVSAEGIVEAIDAKLNSASERLAKLYRIQNNVEAKSEGLRKTLAKMQSLQNEITQAEKDRAELSDLQAKNGQLTSEELIRKSELEAKLQDMDETALNAKRKQIAAYAEMNQKTDEHLQKQREQLENEIALAQAAKERVTAYGFSDTAKDFKEQFGGSLMYKPDEHIGDDNYNTKFKITDEDLEKVKDLVDLEDLWRKKRKEATEYLEKIRKLGISEATVEKERDALEKKKTDARKEILRIEQQIKKEKLLEDTLEYNALVRQLNAEKNQEKRAEIQAKMNALLAKGNTTKYQQLLLEKQSLKAEIAKALASQKLNEQQKADLKAAQEALDELDKVQTRYNFSLAESGGNRGGSGEDPWILLMKNRMKFMQDFQKGVEDLSKWMGYTKGLADEQENMLGRGLSLQIDSRKLDGSKEELIKWYEDSISEIRKRIEKLGGKEWEGLGVQMILAKDTKSRVLKKYQELLADMFKELTDFRTEQTQKALEAKIKELSDRISRTKTAKEFYEKILSQTGDVELAASLSLNIFGENGEDLNKNIRKRIEAIVEDTSATLPAMVFRADNSVDTKALREWAEANEQALGKGGDAYKELIKIANDGEKDVVKMIDGWIKATEKAKTYSDKLEGVSRKTANSIGEIERQKGYAQVELANLLEVKNPTKEQQGRMEALRDLLGFYSDLISGFLRKEADDMAKLQYEAFKDSPMYVQMFDDLDNASSTMLRNMKQRIEELQGEWKNLDPTQLKEMQSRLREIDEQLAKRNPFKGLIDGIKDYRKLRKGGDDGLGPKSEREAEKALDAAAKARLEAEKEYLEILNKEGVTQEEIADAKKRFDKAAADEDTAAKAVENWKKVKDAIGLSANELFKVLNWAGDIAKGIADISEAMGADKEDVQYWNDVADALGQISGGIQDIVSAAMSGNVVGIISSVITAIPKMFVGFANLFSAGKIKRANKEIERQAELLERLEYTYGRLEKAAEKAFGVDYLRNYNAQLRNLRAQQQAYQKQAEAERSKGKKEDEEATRDYLDKARDAADQIADMQEELMAHFAGSTRADVARQMAQSWIEARASMSDTFAAIKGDYQNMVKNMLIESAAARVVENALAPLWQRIEDAYKSSDPSKALDEAMRGMDVFLNNANEGLEVLWKAMEARGYDMKKLLGDTDSSLTGISRDIASASEESINGLATGIHTQNFYISQQLEEVRAIRRLLEGGISPSNFNNGGGIDYTALGNQALNHLAMIERYTGETAARCERAAVACESQVAMLRRVIVPKGSSASHSIQVELK